MTQPTVRPQGPHHQDTRVDVQPVVAAAGTAIVTAARVGRAVGRSGWRLARQLPGATTVEREAQRLQQAVAEEARRRLNPPARSDKWVRTPDERRVVEQLRPVTPTTSSLRNAMAELLQRSVEATRVDSRTYLYATIISQLVPDEARILAALSDGSRFAAADVVQKPLWGKPFVLLTNVSTIGRHAGLTTPDNTPTYLTRLHGLGLIEFGPEDPRLATEYDILATDSNVHHMRESVERRRRNSVRLARKVVHVSSFGRDFWAASDPRHRALPS